MPEMNGQHDNPSRLDRMEKLVGHIIDNHVVLEDKLSRVDDQLSQLADRQRQTDETVNKLSVDVRILHDTAILQATTMDRVITKLAETDASLARLGAETDARLARLGAETDVKLDRLAASGAQTDAKIDRLAALIESDHREYHERLNRLEWKQ